MDSDKGREVQQLLEQAAVTLNVKSPVSYTDVSNMSKCEGRSPSPLYQSDSQVVNTMPDRIDLDISVPDDDEISRYYAKPVDKELVLATLGDQATPQKIIWEAMTPILPALPLFQWRQCNPTQNKRNGAITSFGSSYIHFKS